MSKAETRRCKVLKRKEIINKVALDYILSLHLIIVRREVDLSETYNSHDPQTRIKFIRLHVTVFKNW